MVLQGELSLCGHSGELRVLNDGLAIEHDGEALALHRDLEGVPFADGFVGVHLGRHADADGGGIIVAVP